MMSVWQEECRRVESLYRNYDKKCELSYEEQKAYFWNSFEEIALERNSQEDVSPKPVTKENSHVKDQNDQG